MPSSIITFHCDYGIVMVLFGTCGETHQKQNWKSNCSSRTSINLLQKHVAQHYALAPSHCFHVAFNEPYTLNCHFPSTVPWHTGVNPPLTQGKITFDETKMNTCGIYARSLSEDYVFLIHGVPLNLIGPGKNIQMLRGWTGPG